jgi:hypothetical protein
MIDYLRRDGRSDAADLESALLWGMQRKHSIRELKGSITVGKTISVWEVIETKVWKWKPLNKRI